MSALETVVGTSFNGKFTAKIDFPIGCVMLTLLMLTVEEGLVKFEQNRMVRTTQNCELFDKKKNG